VGVNNTGGRLVEGVSVCDYSDVHDETINPCCQPLMLSFVDFKDEVRDALRSLPDSTSPMIKDGLLAAHQKLSEYCYCFDLSPFYIWAAHESYPIFIFV
jgi:hypothetical protein